MGHRPRRFTVGDRVLVHGGYGGDDSDWLRGGPGYRGTVRKLTANAAAVELDDELELEAPPGAKWHDFDPFFRLCGAVGSDDCAGGLSHDPLDVLGCEELGGRERGGLDADERVHRVLVAVDRTDQLLQLGGRR